MAGDELTLTIGLASERQRRVTGGPIVLPTVEVYTLEAQVAAVGFDLVDEAAGWTHRLEVTADQPYPSFELELVALALPANRSVLYGEIQVQYVLDGLPIGSATRLIAIADSEASRPTDVPKETGANLTMPTDVVAADVTVTIRAVASDPRILLWTLNKARGIAYPRPDGSIPQPIGDEKPRELIERLSAQMSDAEKKPGKYDILATYADAVAAAIPGELWTFLRGVAAEVKRSPRMQILTQEPYLPWELAAFPEPLLDATAPPFLSAQVPVARWVMGSGPSPRPPLAPPHRAPAKSIAVIHGDYAKGGKFKALADSEREAAGIVALWRAKEIDASLKMLPAKLIKPGADIFHFACHGNFDRSGRLDGVMMVDGQSLPPERIGKLDFGERKPFVFLNACQSGQGRKILGDYAGMAFAFLRAGASGVIAPLWSIDDAVSSKIASRFYVRTFRGDLPAEVLRHERRHFKRPRSSDQVVPKSGTWMSYVYFGHPSLQLVRR